VDEKPPPRPLAKVIEHPSVTIARLQHRRDMLADVLLLLLEAIACDARTGRLAIDRSPHLLDAIRRARETLENIGWEVKQ
jgi:hypothetical protein